MKLRLLPSCMLAALLALGLSCLGAGRLAAEPPVLGNGDQIVGGVGQEVVLLSDVLPQVEATLKQNGIDEKTPDYQKIRAAVVQRAIQPVLQRKMVLAAIRRKLPAEAMESIFKQIEAWDFEKREVPRLMKELGVSTRIELIRAMELRGTALKQYKQDYMEAMLAAEWIKEQTKKEDSITHEQMLKYYFDNLPQFEFPAKARWEQLTVEFGAKRTKKEAYGRLAAMGNDVLIRRVPLAEVAKKASEEPLATEGGYHDWTSKNSLASKVLDRAVFSLDAGKLSDIIEDESAFHIVRIIERRAAGRTPFAEAQVEIKKTLQKEAKAQRQKAYVEKLMAEWTVWTIFDEAPQTAVVPQTQR
ncbi:MAG: peptidyl-prolyl cis-trans isomerase [Planctomycetia bacterium]|nr:peptidyl-prolyl cis-trans isomerase [Planctomycetia bacterium]